MNNKLLQIKHPETYKKFFNKYDLILSAPIPIQLTGEFYKYVGNTLSVGYKIPLKIYIWLNKHEHQEENIVLRHRQNKLQDFQQSSLNYFSSLDYAILQDIGISYEIWILCEQDIPSTTIILALINTAHQIYQQKISHKELYQLNILDPNHPKIIHKILNIFTQKQESLNFILQKRSHLEAEIGISFLSSLSFIIAHEESNKPCAFNSILPDKPHFHKLNLTTSIIHDDQNNPTFTTNTNLLEYNNHIQNFFSEKDRDYSKALITWLQHLEKHYSLEILQDIINIYNHKKEWKNFFKNIYHYQNLIKTIFKTENSLEINKIAKQQSFYKHIKEFFQYTPYTFLKNKQILLRSPRSHFITQKDLDQINQKGWHNFSLEYSSAIHGYETNGLQLEQYKWKGKLSPLCSYYQIKKIDKGSISQQADDYNQILTIKDGLVLDTIKQKMYFLGNKLTSSHIRSQSSTIELFKKLIQNIDKDIHNTTLPPSSYSKNKNEMISKIIIPLKKLFQTNTKYELPLHCSGSLSDFFIRLERPPLPIYLVEKNQI